MTVVNINAAHPFMFIVVQRGKTKRLTFCCTSRFCSAACIVTGNAPDDDFENSATDKAGAIPLNALSGFIPFSKSQVGKTINPCTRLAHVITRKYFPIPCKFIP